MAQLVLLGLSQNSASQTLVFMWMTWGSYKKTDSDSVGLGCGWNSVFLINSKMISKLLDSTPSAVVKPGVYWKSWGGYCLTIEM